MSVNTKTVVLSVDNLTVTDAQGRVLAGPVTLSLKRGECVALVGDSGAGKTLTLRALLNLLPEGLTWRADRYEIQGVSVLNFDEKQWNELRGSVVALVQQDTGGALDPLKRIRAEVMESPLVHGLVSETAERHAVAALESAGLPNAVELLSQWPHELSGGMRQRATLASALSATPSLLLADEPTTALDASTQRSVLSTLNDLKAQGLSILLVSHDLTAVHMLADRVYQLTEVGSNELDAQPTLPAQAPSSLTAHTAMRSEHPVLRVEHVSASYGGASALREISFTLNAGRTLGVVGESGAGKTTLARVLTATLPVHSGSVRVEGIDWNARDSKGRSLTPHRSDRWRLQWVPQDPLGSFARGMTVGQILSEAVRLAKPRLSASSLNVRELLGLVSLDVSFEKKKPRELSGGQRQRVAIARAIAVRPNVLICDEAVSALDATARSGILELLRGLQEELDVAIVFISHDLDVVAAISDDLLVMQDGEVVEQGSATSVLGAPQHPFTQELLSSSEFLTGL